MTHAGFRWREVCEEERPHDVARNASDDAIIGIPIEPLGEVEILLSWGSAASAADAATAAIWYLLTWRSLRPRQNHFLLFPCLEGEL